MATTKVYSALFGKVFDKEVDLLTDTLKVALVTSSYTPDQDAHDYWADVSANEASGTGYTAGGATLGSTTFTYDDGSNKWTFDGADVSWSSSTITARYAVIYDDTATSKNLIAYVDFGTDQSSSAGTFTVSWNASGIFTITVG